MAQIAVLLRCIVKNNLSGRLVIALFSDDLTSSPNSTDMIMRREHEYVLILTLFSLSLCTGVCINRKMMEVCGEAENRLASELMQHELQIEKDVLDPLSQLAEVRNLTPSGHNNS